MTDTGQQTLTIQQAIDLAVQHHNAGRLPEAEGIYTQVLQAEPNQPVALHLLGVIAQQMGKNDIAVDFISKALAIKPDYAEAHSNLGNAFIELGRLDEAVASHNKALAIKPSAIAHYNLGNALKALGKLDEAVANYNKALAIKPDFAEAHSNLGDVLHKLGKLDEAVANYNKALAIKPDYAEALSSLGNALQDLNKLDEAVANYNKALAVKPDFAIAHYNLGNTLHRLGKLDEAVASYNKALAIKPDFAIAHYNLGTLLQQLGRLEDAISSYDLSELDYSRSKSLECLYALKRYEDFYLNLDKLIETDTKSIRAAAISTFASQQLNRANPHPFCKNPMDFVRVYDNLVGLDDEDEFLQRLVYELKSREAVWEPNGKATHKGFQSTSNLFVNPTGLLADLERTIKDKIEIFRSEFSSEDCDFIRFMPKTLSLRGWAVRLLNGGHQTEHLHTDGWLSGVFYVQMPELCKQEEGSIEFGLWGYNYPILDKNFPRKRYYPKNGNLVLFPSSLFHRTIPFDSDEERMCVAFDLIPTKSIIREA